MNPTTRGLSINSEACFYFNTAQQSEVDQRLDLKFCATVEFLYRYLIQSFRSVAVDTNETRGSKSESH